MSGTERRWQLEESILVDASVEEVYATVADARRMAAFSPELRTVLVRGGRRGPLPVGTSFTGINSKGVFWWFTNSRVVKADADRDFAFEVTSFGMPVALWGFRTESEGDGTRVTEYWEDRRRGRQGKVVEKLGLLTGTRAEVRHEVNAAGMRVTLGALKRSVEEAAARRTSEAG